MRMGVLALVRLIVPACWLVYSPVHSQTSIDSVSIDASKNEVNRTVPQARSGKLFFDPLRPAREGLRPTVLYSGDDRIYGGLTYHNFSRNWKADSSGQKHKAYLHYSLTQKAFSTGYQGIFNQLVGKWDAFAEASYDWVKWINFYGLGNETVQQTNDANYYRIRTQEGFASLAFRHRLGKQSTVTLTPFFQHLQFRNDPDRFLTLEFPAGKTANVYEAKNYGGLRGDLLLSNLDNLLLPTKGSVVSASITHGENIVQRKGYTQYVGGLCVYFPLSSHFVLMINNGAATVTGRPEFFQLNSLGGNTLRGYRRERFWGETIYHNNNELQYIFDAPGKLIGGKAGFSAFVDQGRVWKQGEVSSAWHRGFGGGILLVPRNKVYVSAQYGISSERQGFHFTYRRMI